MKLPGDQAEASLFNFHVNQEKLIQRFAPHQAEGWQAGLVTTEGSEIS